MLYKIFWTKLPLASGLLGIFCLVLSLVWETFTVPSKSFGNSAFSVVGLTLSALSLVLYLVNKIRNDYGKPGFYTLVLLHCGLLVTLVGFLLNHLYGSKGFIYIREGESSAFYVDENNEEHPLDFALKLNNFRVQTYPKSLRIQTFESDLTIEDNGRHERIHLLVNDAFTYRGYRFYQHDYGLHIGRNPRILVDIETAYETLSLQMRMEESINIAECGVLTILDFIPTALFRNGQIHSQNKNAVLNPAYLIEIQPLGAPPSHRWILPKDKSTENIDNCRIHFRDFTGIEYSVLSIARSPFDPLIFLGFTLSILGCAGFMRIYRAKSK